MSDDYQIGDIVKISRTIEVTNVSADGITGRDVQSNQEFWHNKMTDGTLRIEMVRRAPRPKPETGAVVSGRDVKRIQWKRGTIIRCVVSDTGTSVTSSGMVLREDGLWYPLDNDRFVLNPTYEFEELADEARFELRFIA